MSTTSLTQTAIRRKPAVNALSTTHDAEPDSAAEKYFVPNITINEVLSVIPAHCFERSFFRSSLYLIQDVAALTALVYGATTYIPKINPENVPLPHVVFYPVVRFLAWAVYGYVAGLVCTGLFYIGHECGHGAYSTSKLANDIVGFFVHSAIAVPYVTWKLSHRQHHAHTSHIGVDQPHEPMTRRYWNLPQLDEENENVQGTWVSPALQEVLEEVMEFSPFGSVIHNLIPTFGWWMCMFFNMESQQTKKYKLNYPPFRKPMCKDRTAVIISCIGSGTWLLAQLYCAYTYGLLHTFRVWIMPHVWYNHWLIMISYLNHTDPGLPHWDDSAFTFVRGALTTLDRELMGGPGVWAKICNWICCQFTHAFCELHVVHHVCPRIPHYNAWEAKEHVHAFLKERGINAQGNPCTYSEVFRVVTECKFIEDEGGVRFYKNAQGKAARVPVMS